MSYQNQVEFVVSLRLQIKVAIRIAIHQEKKKTKQKQKTQVMFGNGFYFLFSKTYFWEYKKKNNILVFLKSKTCLVS